ncbi:branched-chain amino acid ABC transporter ATP-binding protein/permease [Blastococcus brunescens]|uniref:Branched-chain amino acid ABC transporter ATP-binding protein/permease n=1 Tax=Blastococcus brunescens TaxID=1564165 RepID=A0ABZ1B8Z9_9ACTN|nr:branched-chain amino acid ABC transporter ATP-binding protein/permease [Blastococcus sp. BMG 8361]WRL67214.1 branched-chain amino acid ABC transporter ATP-binding protein/permease [Blastococcus sp. BMG 8361]
MDDRDTFHYFALTVCLIIVALLWWVTRSPVGRAIDGMRASPTRMAALGYNIGAYKVSAFLISGVASALTGALFAYQQQFVGVEMLDWTTSATILLAAIVGGARHFLGPALGIGVLIAAETVLAEYTDRWTAVLGLLYILTILLLPEGILGVNRWFRRRSRPDESMAGRPATHSRRASPRRRGALVVEPAIEVEDIRVNFRGVTALDGVSLSVPAGQRRALIGPNGAGKTTLFNVLSGSLRPTTGRVSLFGEEMRRTSVQARARKGLARTFQITNLLSDLSVRENVLLATAAVKSSTRITFWRPLVTIPGVSDRTEELLRRWELWSVRDRTVSELAYGQQRVLEIVMALASDPKVLLLDEPTAGLSKRDAAMLTDVAAALPESLSLLVIEHDMDVAFTLGEVVTVLADGKVLEEGPPDAIRSSPVVIETYLGEHDDAA